MPKTKERKEEKEVKTQRKEREAGRMPATPATIVPPQVPCWPPIAITSCRCPNPSIPLWRLPVLAATYPLGSGCRYYHSCPPPQLDGANHTVGLYAQA
ncbi:hypothetical protein Nepgr_004846 [Nepenthes gracilis]|uniref:Uncharacterized protein n=1 Tax=Nepenthes gracilis TaxID=150966 RepID=A0AAD3S2A0_NEPGR|nr:hypothetical protein Nepgr_004846 [Nepenthes gracilis]